MKRMTIALLAALTALGSGCGFDLESEAQKQLDALDATRAGGAIVDAAQSLGLLPRYTCGAPEKVQFATLRPQLDQSLGGCTRVVDGASTATSDSVDLVFPGDGCEVLGTTWTGAIRTTYSGGEDRTLMAADLHQLSINGHAVDGRIARLTCGDVDTYQVELGTRIPATQISSAIDLAFKGTVTMRPGLPFIGTDFTIVDGPATLTYEGVTVSATFKQVFWEMGANLPAKGEIDLGKPDGTVVAITFTDSGLEVSIDGGPALPVPLP